MSTAKSAYFAYSDALQHPGDFATAARRFFSSDANINIVHPFNETEGAEGYVNRFLSPLQEAFDGVHRRHDIAMSGTFEGADWVSATGYYVGHFKRDWIGLRATDRLTYLRFGEFFRIENGQAVEAYVFLDLPELMISCGQWPLRFVPGDEYGHTGLIQGPASQDGILRGEADPESGARSYRIVTEMLAGLATEDEAWRPYWHENMRWYGPGAWGSFVGVEHFRSFQVPFESQFEGWSGGSANNGMTRHFTRYGEGNYTCSGGWPSLTGVNVKPFMGFGPTKERVFFRVCDWWRREGDLLVENWVFVDVPHALLQFGFDVLPRPDEVRPDQGRNLEK
ncbi:MAG: hypothetical protein AAF999_14205 [Pseudomonadota bacterium]